MISPLIKWQHDEQWQTDDIHSEGISQSGERKFTSKVKNDENLYICDHIIDGRNLYPGMGYLWLVQETIAMIENKNVTDVSVVFENVHFEHALLVRDKGAFFFIVSIHKLSRHFEVKGNDTVVAKGRIRLLESPNKELIVMVPNKNEIIDSDMLPMHKDDFYKELRLRGYNYKGFFKNVEYVNLDGYYGEISWQNNFVCFMDGMAQTTLLHMDCRNLLVPTFIQKIVIDFEEHFRILDSLDKENPKFPVNFYPLHGVLRSGGIQMNGWGCAEIARQKSRFQPAHEICQFIPYITEEREDLASIVLICVQFALKNTYYSKKTITYELLDQEYDPELTAISSAILDTFKMVPSIEPNVNVLINTEKVEETIERDGINISHQKLPKDKSALLIIVSNIHNKTDLLESIFDALNDDGYIITTVPISENILFENLGLGVYASRLISDSEKFVLLSKKTTPKPIKQAIQIKNDTFFWIGEIQNAISNLKPENNEKLVVFSENEPSSGILGFFNCLREELKGSNISCVFIMDETAPTFSLDNPFYKSQLDKNLRFNIFKDGEWGNYWHLPLDTSTYVEPSHAFCMLEERGNLSSFKWVQGPLDPSTYDNSNGRSLVHVYYSSLNFKDIIMAVGRISITDLPSYSRLIESYLGNEFSGKDENGKRLMGMVSNKGIATMVESIPYTTWKVPDSITLEEAASIPVVYATVIYAFFFKMQLKKGCSILIHSGCGGIGQAAINICLHYECNIFTTVGTPEKVEFIKNTFPQIPENHIGNSRDTSFHRMITEQTNGKGVDVVLNSLAEDKLRASILCVAEGGHFLEIGKFDMAKNNSLELRHFLNDITFYSVQLDVLMKKKKSETILRVRDKLQEMLDQGIIKPIRRTVFESNEVESAFRYMASGKHIGKLVIKIRDEEQDIKTIPTLLRLKANSRVYLHKNKSYVILGGLGGIGMELVDWLILRGARNIILSSRTGVKNGYQSYRIKLWRLYGVNVIISTANILQESGVEEILEKANSLGPVAGIFNLALVLKDDVFSNQTEENFRIVAGPKAIATHHLDRLSRKMCPHLEHFVMFSSMVSGHGNADQTNYGFSNSIMERICEQRRSDNLPGIAIQWGAVGEVGYFSNLIGNNLSISLRGFAQQSIKSCMETMNRFMTIPHPIISSRVIAEKHKITTDIITTVANLLGIKDMKSISMTWTLTELGMDSIMGMELKQILETEFDIFLTPEDLRTMTFAKLQRLKEEKENTPNQGNKVTTNLQFFLNEELLNQPILRIPLMEGKVQEQLSINENFTAFVFPGSEGLALNIEPLARNLSIQTLCCQYHFDADIDFGQKLCNYFSSYILEELQPEKEFCLIGYSAGSIIAMEVAEILEKQGRKGRIYLIDGSPTMVQLINTKKIQDIGTEKYDEFAQNKICSSLITTVLPTLPKEAYLNYLENAADWASKKKVTSSILSKITKIEIINHKLFDSLFHMFKAASQYERSTSFSLQSPCILIRCAENYFDLPLDESYGLTNCFKNPVEVHKIEDVDHNSILMHPKTADIIMSSLPRATD